MSLSSPICRRCVTERAQQTSWHDDAGTMMDALVAAFVNDWSSGHVWCDVFGEGRLPKQAKVNELPPEWCPYAAEHAVSGEAEQGNL